MLYAIITDNVLEKIDLIKQVKSFLKHQSYDIDFVIFTDNIYYGYSDSAILTTFYTIAHNGCSVFLNLNDYYHYRDKISGKSIVYLTKDDINHLDYTTIKNCNIITNNNDKLEWVKNNEL